ncbi:MAG TPA: DNA translocase FtsK 4TM domain-containing protein [Candidatus Paceibacterota bacterium]
MAKKKEPEIIKKVSFWREMEDGTVRAIMAVILFAIAFISLLAAFGKAGWGNHVFDALVHFLGVGYYLIPIISILLGLSFLRTVEERRLETPKIVGSVLFFFSSLGLIYLISDTAAGVLGGWISRPLIALLDMWAAAILLVAVFIVSLIMMFEWEPTLEWLSIFKKKPAELAKDKDKALKAAVADGEMDEDEEARINQAVAAAGAAEGEDEEIQDETDRMMAERRKELEAKQAARADAKNAKTVAGGKLDLAEGDGVGFVSPAAVPTLKPFTPPPFSLLERDKGKPETGDIKANANIIKRTLQNFGITVEMDEISIGPSVTRYALKPAEGVKLARIVALNNDLALALAAHPIRIEAPIPGKSLVGIEVPNMAKTTVGLGTLLNNPDFTESEKPLLVSLGKDISGKAHFANLAKAPHMLIAGATGSGKSVTIHTIITSLLFRRSPENLKFIMIDPKRVELTLYNKSPHLLTPVITDPKKAILALKWAAKEMTRRYDLLEKCAVRDIDSYHKNVLAPELEAIKKREADGEEVTDEEKSRLPEIMPYIVIVIDELADIMQTYPRELESAIVRLAQMSRAVGIHLIISTQRPSVNVITGLIKANVPTRVALQVASQIDSRTILDQAGAEKLLGAGDTLYLGGDMSKPVRLQAAYISESEVKSVVKHLINEYKDEIMGEINIGPGPEAGSSAAFDAMGGALDGDSLEDEDEMYEPAREAVIAAGKASTSYIQRKLGVGYSRAAKLMDLLESHGVIGPANGSKPREVIGVGAGMDGSSGGASGESDQRVPDSIDL